MSSSKKSKLISAFPVISRRKDFPLKSCLRNILVSAAVLGLTCSLKAQTITLVSGNGTIGTRDPVNSFSVDQGATFTNAYIVSPISLYNTIPGTQWIGIQSNGYGPDNFTNIYRVFFTLPGSYVNPSLSIQILADDQASVFLNGTLIGSQPFPGVTPNYGNPPSVFSTSNGSLFLT